MLRELGINFIPLLLSAAEKISNLINWFQALPEPVKKAISIFLILIATLGTVAVAVNLLMGDLIKFIFSLDSVKVKLLALNNSFKSFWVVLTGTSTRMKAVNLTAARAALGLRAFWAALTGPIGIIIAIVSLIGILAWKYIPGFRNAIIGAGKAIKGFVVGLKDFIVGMWKSNEAVDHGESKWTKAGRKFGFVKDAVAGLLNGIKDLYTFWFMFLRNLVEEIQNVINWNEIWEAVTTKLGNAWRRVKSWFTDGIEDIKKRWKLVGVAFKAFGPSFLDPLKKKFNELKETVQGWLDKIEEAAEKIPILGRAFKKTREEFTERKREEAFVGPPEPPEGELQELPLPSEGLTDEDEERIEDLIKDLENLLNNTSDEAQKAADKLAQFVERTKLALADEYTKLKMERDKDLEEFGKDVEARELINQKYDKAVRELDWKRFQDKEQSYERELQMEVELREKSLEDLKEYYKKKLFIMSMFGVQSREEYLALQLKIKEIDDTIADNKAETFRTALEQIENDEKKSLDARIALIDHYLEALREKALEGTEIWEEFMNLRDALEEEELTRSHQRMEDFFQGMINTFESALGTWFQGGQKLSEFLDGLWGNIRKSFFNMAAGMITDFIFVDKKITLQAVKGAAKRIGFAIKEAIARMFSWYASLGPFGIVAGVAAIAGLVALIKKFTALAEGGVVLKPTLALLGERGPEAVVPLDRAAAVGGPAQVTKIFQVDMTRSLVAVDNKHQWRKVARNNMIPAIEDHDDSYSGVERMGTEE
jgi:hypothetical protein